MGGSQGGTTAKYDRVCGCLEVCCRVRELCFGFIFFAACVYIYGCVCVCGPVQNKSGQ